MDKGIRPEARRQFRELLPQRAALGNTVFRKTVMANLMEQFGCTLASAATHYNDAFLNAKQEAVNNPELAQLLVGLGRPEDKKGGRKKKVATPTQPVSTVIPQDPNQVLNQLLTAPAPAAPVVEEEPAPTKTFRVIRKKDGANVAGGLTEEQATELVERARAAKKAALEMVEE